MKKASDIHDLHLENEALKKHVLAKYDHFLTIMCPFSTTVTMGMCLHMPRPSDWKGIYSR